MKAEERTFWAEIVDALNGLYGAHDGHRAVHAKGTLCSATFTATPAARTLTRAPHMQGAPVRAHVRFSNAGGDPTSRDGSRDSRGMAVKFYLPDGSTTDISSVTIPVFAVRTPQDFLELTLALRPDPETGKPDLDKMGKFIEAHPESLPAVEAALTAKAPASFLSCTYFAVHAFKFVNADGEERWIRYRWQPASGESWLEKDEAKERDHDYLRADLEDRLSSGPATFLLSVEIAADGDPIDDPTAAWPEERERIEIGRLDVRALASDRERDGDVLVMDPTRVTDGIELSDDPILLARPHAYEESVFRRSGVRRDG